MANRENKSQPVASGQTGLLDSIVYRWIEKMRVTGPSCWTDQETTVVKNTLIKRDKELHGSDLMHINKTYVILIEPVSPESQVAKLLKEAMAQKPAETK